MRKFGHKVNTSAVSPNKLYRRNARSSSARKPRRLRAERRDMSEEKAKRRVPKWVKITAIVLAAIIVLCAALVGAAAIVWRHEISTLSSFKKLADRDHEHQDGAVYRMDVSGGFYFDDFLAQGGAANDGDLINFITNKITRGLIKMNIEQSEIACSAFTAVTAEGDRIFAYAPLDGVNEKGLSCGIFMSYQGQETVATDQQTDKDDITSTTMMRMILDYCATVDEAVAMIEKYDMHDSAQTSFHYMIADATGRSAILEWTYGTDATDNDGTKRELHVIYNDDDAHIGAREGAADYQWITNFILQPDYYGDDDPDADNDAADALKPGYDRYVHIYDQLRATNGEVEDMQAAMDILASVGRRNWNNDDSNGITVHSVVYNLTKQTVMWVANEHYGEEAYTFEFSLRDKF